MNEPLALDDRELHRAITSFHRLRWAIVIVCAALLVMAVTGLALFTYTQHQQIVALRVQQAAACSFFADLAALPVNPVPPAKRPSQLGVTIVVDSRIAAVGLACPHVPPPSNSLKKWAAYYHIPVP